MSTLLGRTPFWEGAAGIYEADDYYGNDLLGMESLDQASHFLNAHRRHILRTHFLSYIPNPKFRFSSEAGRNKRRKLGPRLDFLVERRTSIPSRHHQSNFALFGRSGGGGGELSNYYHTFPPGMCQRTVGSPGPRDPSSVLLSLNPLQQQRGRWEIMSPESSSRTELNLNGGGAVLDVLGVFSLLISPSLLPTQGSPLSSVSHPKA